jgi:hypothetical protein
MSSKPVGQQPGRQLQRFHPLASYAYRNVPLLKYVQGVDAQGYSNAIYSVSVYVTTVITSNIYEFINSREKDTQFNAQDCSNAIYNVSVNVTTVYTSNIFQVTPYSVSHFKSIYKWYLL